MQVRTIVEVNGKEYSSDWEECSEDKHKSLLKIIADTMKGKHRCVSIKYSGTTTFFNKKILEQSIITIETDNDL